MSDHVIIVNLTTAERKAIAELSYKQELSPEKVMINALRQYQLVVMGHAELVFPPTSPELRLAWEPEL